MRDITRRDIFKLGAAGAAVVGGEGEVDALTPAGGLSAAAQGDALLGIAGAAGGEQEERKKKDEELGGRGPATLAHGE